MDYKFKIHEDRGVLKARYQVRTPEGKWGPRKWAMLWPRGEQPYRSRLSKKQIDERAHEVIEEAIGDESLSTQVALVPGKVCTIGQWLERAQEDPGVKGEIADRTRKERDQHLSKFVFWCGQRGIRPQESISVITPSLIERYASDLVRGGFRLPSGNQARPRTRWSAAREIKPIQRAFNWLLDNEEIEGVHRNPVRMKFQQFKSEGQHRQQVKDRSVDQETLDLLLENCDGTLVFDNRGAEQAVPMTTSYMHPLIMLMSHSGMRTGEARQARWSDIDWDAGVIRIRAGKTGNRDVPMVSKLKRYLERRLENLQEVGVDTDHILCLEDGSMLKKDTISRAFRRYCDRLGLDNSVMLYGLRHYFAHLCAERNVPITHLMRFMGHSNLRTTQVYTHSEVENVMDSLKGVF